MATAQAGASATSFPLPMGSLAAQVHFIPQQWRQWGPRASAETLQNGSGMRSWSRSICWWRRHAPWSLPPTLHHQHGFVALQEQGPCPLTYSWPKLDVDSAPGLLGSVFGSSLLLLCPLPGGPELAAPGGDPQTHQVLLHCEEGCQHILPKNLPRPG